ncbi:glycerophosphocholine phosphodiesterase GPCPD1 [Mytilus galloprovincialis]|uniref:Glycerophosphocholine phosphodiesterase GPCPD1 n=1 Tax=Mytilus galloprovincialis TaxID=29158 RepID=A0A8B6EA67_MYTGA|nr:glycerophosphocholine phosphodiesterase GPCPD1 [Mytilus galloprovincialis]
MAFEVTFCVRAETDTGDSVCLVGDCEKIGNWNPHHAVILTRVSSPVPSKTANITSNGMNVWKKTITLSDDAKDCRYRYFIARIVESDSEDSERVVDVLRWETNIKPRLFSPRDYLKDPAMYENTIDTFGEFGQKKHVSTGWLTDETEIHLRLHSNPIYMWKSRHRTQTYSVKCTPLDLRFRDTMHGDEEDDYQPDTIPTANYTKVLVSTLKSGQEKPQIQKTYGEVYNPDDFMIFSARTIDPEYLGFQLNWFVHFPDKEPKNIGYNYILPMEMKNTNDVKTILITGLTHKPIGQVKVDYLLIKPLAGLPMTMEVSYQNYWNFERAALDIGHKGMGSAHSQKESVRENTIASLQSAGSHGADFVEFDVMLSKDLVPVIYHDFHVFATYRKKRRDELENFRVSVKDLTVAELQSMQLSSVHAANEKDDRESDERYEDNVDPKETQPFPTLKQCFEDVDEHVGFNVEVKYPMLRMNGYIEESTYFDRNKFVDIILKSVFENAKDRRIVFSSFDPDICTLLRLKQNKYPVLLLTVGRIRHDEERADPRCVYVPIGVNFVNFANILGINVNSKTILDNHELIKDVKKSGQVLFCWGEETNDSNVINKLRELGVDGIIYDRWMVHEDVTDMWIVNDAKNIIGIDQLKSTKENVFKLEKRLKENISQPVDNDSK